MIKHFVAWYPRKNIVTLFDIEAFSTHANATAVLGGRVKFAD